MDSSYFNHAIGIYIPKHKICTYWMSNLTEGNILGKRNFQFSKFLTFGNSGGKKNSKNSPIIPTALFKELSPKVHIVKTKK